MISSAPAGSPSTRAEGGAPREAPHPPQPLGEDSAERGDGEFRPRAPGPVGTLSHQHPYTGGMTAPRDSVRTTGPGRTLGGIPIDGQDGPCDDGGDP